MRVLAIDYGRSRVGLAISDPLGCIAQPLEIVPRKELDKKLGEVIQKHRIKIVVLGYPINMDGTSSDMSEEVEAFKQTLEAKYNVKVKLVDERLSSAEAEKTLKRLGAKQLKSKVDSISASLILQKYLERQR